MGKRLENENKIQIRRQEELEDYRLGTRIILFSCWKKNYNK